MPISLYTAIVPTFLQVANAQLALLDTAADFCTARGQSEADLLATRLADDMFALSYQFRSVGHHSFGAIDGVRAGSFSPDRSEPPAAIEPLREKLRWAISGLEAVTEDEMDGFVERAMEFRFGEIVIPFAADQFLLTFSQPNFMFHATTAYDILRWQGAAIGKRDFMGRLRTQTQ